NALADAASLDSPLTGDQISTASGNANLVRGGLGIAIKSFGGAGVTVAVVDSGIDPSSGDFDSRIKAFYDFTQGGIQTNPYDDFGHGTGVAGIIAGSEKAGNGGDPTGIAPGVSLIGFKVLDSTGNGLTSNVISALQFAT